MKNTNKCPKCGGTEIIRFNGYSGPYGTGNNLMVGRSIFSAVNVNRFVCASCGYTEEWIDKEDLKAVTESKKGIREGDE